MAAASIRIKVDPASQRKLEKTLDSLPAKVYKRVVGGAANFAMGGVVTAARAKVPSNTGTLKKSLGKRKKNYKRAGVVLIVAGPRKGFIDPQTGEDPAKIAHLVERGTVPHAISGVAMNINGEIVRGTVQHPGAKAKPFLGPALYQQAGNVLIRYRQKLWRGIQREAKRAGR